MMARIIDRLRTLDEDESGITMMEAVVSIVLLGIALTIVLQTFLVMADTAGSHTTRIEADTRTDLTTGQFAADVAAMQPCRDSGLSEPVLFNDGFQLDLATRTPAGDPVQVSWRLAGDQLQRAETPMVDCDRQVVDDASWTTLAENATGTVRNPDGGDAICDGTCPADPQLAFVAMRGAAAQTPFDSCDQDADGPTDPDCSVDALILSVEARPSTTGRVVIESTQTVLSRSRL